MPSKIPPTSLRIPPGLRPILLTYAETRGLRLHAALMRLVKIGLEHDFAPEPVTTPTVPKAILAEAEAKAAHLGTTKRPRRAWNLKGVHLGPVDPPLGSRLKGAGNTPRKDKR